MFQRFNSLRNQQYLYRYTILSHNKTKLKTFYYAQTLQIYNFPIKQSYIDSMQFINLKRNYQNFQNSNKQVPFLYPPFLSLNFQKSSFLHHLFNAHQEEQEAIKIKKRYIHVFPLIDFVAHNLDTTPLRTYTHIRGKRTAERWNTFGSLIYFVRAGGGGGILLTNDRDHYRHAAACSRHICSHKGPAALHCNGEYVKDTRATVTGPVTV